MELGLFQLAWLEFLEQHPEMQRSGLLASGDTNNFKACCLGAALIVYNKMFNLPISFDKCGLLDDGNSNNITTLSASYNKLGLRSSYGSLKQYAQLEKGNFGNLADMNDGGMTWPEIAKYIRENPDNVFNKSV